MVWLIYLIVGLFSGVLAGLFGVGGGVVLVPAFLLLFVWQNISPEVVTYLAVGSSLACIVFSSASSMWSHHKKSAVLWPTFLWMAPGIAVGSFIGVNTALQISSDTLQLIIGIFLVLMAIKFLFEVSLSFGVVQQRLPSHFGLMSAGAFIGWLSGIFGIGGGTLTVPFLQHFGQKMKKAVATSSACGFPIAVVGAISNMYLGYQDPKLPAGAIGYVYLPAVLAVVIASMPGAKLGVLLAHRLPSNILKRFFGLFVGVVGAYLVFKIST